MKNKTTELIDKISITAGKVSYFFTLALVLLVFGNVLLRYFFKVSINWLLELEWHAFGIIFLLGAPVALLKNQHIRVDLFLPAFSPLKQRLVNGLGHLFLLMPWCVIAIATTWAYASNAFYFKESSPNPGGLPAWYIVKYVVSLSFVLLLLQGVAEIIKVVKKTETGFPMENEVNHLPGSEKSGHSPVH